MRAKRDPPECANGSGLAGRGGLQADTGGRGASQCEGFEHQRVLAGKGSDGPERQRRVRQQVARQERRGSEAAERQGNGSVETSAVLPCVHSVKRTRMAVAAAVAARQDGYLIAIIADEDTITGFLLAGVGHADIRKRKNFLVVDSKTTTRAIEDAFKDFTSRDDVAVLLISQYIANMIRYSIDSYDKTLPAILEIPSKEHPYDPSQDSILSRVKHMFSNESVSDVRG